VQRFLHDLVQTRGKGKKYPKEHSLGGGGGVIHERKEGEGVGKGHRKGQVVERYRSKRKEGHVVVEAQKQKK
jgi:hypothetical protein